MVYYKYFIMNLSEQVFNCEIMNIKQKAEKTKYSLFLDCCTQWQRVRYNITLAFIAHFRAKHRNNTMRHRVTGRGGGHAGLPS